MKSFLTGVLMILIVSQSYPSLCQSPTSWKSYSVRRSIDTGYLSSRKLFHDRSKGALQNNIADFYLYKNGELVKPSKVNYDFFPAGCLCFKFDDTLLLNSGLGLSQGVGVGIKIVQGKFTSSLHANSGNKQLYKFSKNDSIYLKDINAEPETQSLKLFRTPSFTADEVIIGEYTASYKKFFQKNHKAKDEMRKYAVRIIFKCKVTGMESLKNLTGMNQ